MWLKEKDAICINLGMAWGSEWLPSQRYDQAGVGGHLYTYDTDIIYRMTRKFGCVVLYLCNNQVV